jgi:hypothetical protein
MCPKRSIVFSTIASMLIRVLTSVSMKRALPPFASISLAVGARFLIKFGDDDACPRFCIGEAEDLAEPLPTARDYSDLLFKREFV